MSETMVLSPRGARFSIDKDGILRESMFTNMELFAGFKDDPETEIKLLCNTLNNIWGWYESEYVRRSGEWVDPKNRIPDHQQDCIVISDGGAVRRVTFWKKPDDAAGVWYLDTFHRVIVCNVILWTPTPLLPITETYPIPDYAIDFPIVVKCPKGCAKHEYPVNCPSRVAHFCGFCGSPLEWVKEIQVNVKNDPTGFS